MASERPSGDWRHQGGGKRPPTSGTSRRAWQPGGEDAKASARRKRSPWLRRSIAAFVTLALLGVAIWLIWLFWPARYPELAIAGDNPGDTLAVPEAVAGYHAARELADWATGGDHPKLVGTTPVTADADGVKITVDPNPKNLVIYLTANGGADTAGAYLWVAPAKAASAAEARKVRVSDILARIAEQRREKSTLLIFDATRVTTSWPHGLVFNDFARALKELDADIQNIPGLVVVCASDEDQRSWLFEERKMSAFGYYFLEALRGDGHEAGSRITAASAFERAKANVERWAVANRNEKQTPILLPRGTGAERAQKIALAAAPPGGYTTPEPAKLPPPSADIAEDLRQAWATADELGRRNPPPEAHNPGKWREYLDMLMRWERLYRLGADTGVVSGHVHRLAGELNSSTSMAAAGLTCLSTAIPTASALGQATPETVTKANQVITKLLADGVTGKNLEAADKELKAIFEQGGPMPVEAHFVRMLHRDPSDSRPRPTTDAALLKKAITVRLQAELTAWRFGAGDKDYPYDEFVFPWVRKHIDDADGLRALGQDLLFSPDPADWQKAATYLDQAQAEYALAAKEGREVVLALATRDRVFAQLPYYARWLANYRGNRPDDELPPLLDHAEKSARKAHELARLTLTPGTPLDKLTAVRADVERDFGAVKAAFEADIKVLTATNAVNPSDWHALDGALGVPFIPAQRRAELLGRLRYVSHQLESNRQQLTVGEARVLPPAARLTAARNRQMALALLGQSSTDTASPHDWWQFYRADGDKIGERFRALSGEANAEANHARNITGLSEAGQHLAAGAFRTRLIDPAAPYAPVAPLANDFHPLAADQAFTRHEMLLWQARRVTTEGWAGVAPTEPARWYCRDVARNLTESARTLVQERVAQKLNGPQKLSTEELKPWLVDYAQEQAHQPLELSLNADRSRIVADELGWKFTFGVAKKSAGTAGFPISWLDPPSNRYAIPDAAKVGRQVQRELYSGQPASRTVAFVAPGKPTDEATPGRLVSKVFYRGHVYEQPTALTRVGTPTREWVYSPPPDGKDDKAAFAIRANESAVAGTVTILIDLTASMNTKIDPNGGPTRLEAAKLAVETLLKRLPDNTWVTLGFFYGDGARTKPAVGVFARPEQLNAANRGRLCQPFLDVTPDRIKQEGKSTPLAGAIEQVLLEANRAKYWPEKFTGSRTLIVVTDGLDNWGTCIGDDKKHYDSVYKDRDGKKTEPGPLALEALLGTKEEVNLHIVFFGMAPRAAGEPLSEEERAREQFRLLTEESRFNTRKPPRTPARILAERDAERLARYCYDALLPRFPYRSVTDAGDRAKLDPTLPGDGGIKVSPALPPENYKLWGTRDQESRQTLELRPGARVMLEARRGKDSEFTFVLPAYGLDVAKKKHAVFAEDNGMYAMIPAARLATPPEGAELKLILGMEPTGERKPADLLEVARPRGDFVWFEVAGPDGKPAPVLRVENRWHVWAPTWDLTATRWDAAKVDSSSVRRPAVTGYWLGGFPASPVEFTVKSKRLDESLSALQDKTYRVGDSEVKVVGIDAENYDPDNSNVQGIPKGKYLTIRIQSTKPGDRDAPGERVFLHPPAWKGNDRPWLLHQHHAYYDAHGRYTARFGPITDNDPDETITFALYSVEDLKKSSRAVTVKLPDGPLPSGKDVMDDLTRPPLK